MSCILCVFLLALLLDSLLGLFAGRFRLAFCWPSLRPLLAQLPVLQGLLAGCQGVPLGPPAAFSCLGHTLGALARIYAIPLPDASRSLETHQHPQTIRSKGLKAVRLAAAYLPISLAPFPRQPQTSNQHVGIGSHRFVSAGINSYRKTHL